MRSSRSLIIIIVILLLLITIAAVGVTIWSVFFREAPPVVLAPDYAPPETEDNAEKIPNDSDEKLEAPEGGGAVSLSYSKVVKIDISDKAASLYFGNPGRSTQDMVLQIVVQDHVLAQSGRLVPGHQVSKLDLEAGMADLLSPGGYEGKFVVLFYNQETGEKAMVNTEIPLTIEVTE